jgi:hypothetical protein
MIDAGYRSTCACGHQIEEGDPIGQVDGEWVCEDCVASMGEDELPSDVMFGAEHDVQR